MDCAECAQHVRRALADLPDVEAVDVFLASEKAMIQHSAAQLDMNAVHSAVEKAGYTVPSLSERTVRTPPTVDYSRTILTLFGVVAGVVLFVVLIGEWMGLFETLTNQIPWPIWLFIILAGGYPVFRNVLRATLNRQIIAHTLMTAGLLAAIFVGEWSTAVVVMFFMRVGDFVEGFTAERARLALKNLAKLTPQTARVDQLGEERVVPIALVRVGDAVVVRPGEMIPVDGAVTRGHATIDQSTITGESMPVEVGPGSQVFATTHASLGSLRIEVTHVGPDTIFGRVIKLVEGAEANRAHVQRLADKFATYYLPLVFGIALVTYLIGGNPLATAAVLVVSCSCSFALATPIAMLASIGAGAKRGLLIKGGRYLEELAQADVLLIDKTGTITLGRPQITDILPLNGLSENEVLTLAATAERYSEHPLAEAVRKAALQRNLPLLEPGKFEALPGLGVTAEIKGETVTVGKPHLSEGEEIHATIEDLEKQGKSILMVAKNGDPIGVMAAIDILRAEVPEALEAVRRLGVEKIELLTGDHQRIAAEIAHQLQVDYRASLTPAEKIAIVKEYQNKGHKVIMVGDGVNDAPALAQADVGIAMGAFGSDVAIEAAHIALLRDDWRLIPEVIGIARRTMRVVTLNIAFTSVYNVVGLSLAAFGFLPPILAAAAQSLPDIGILGNSSRLLRQK
jgi:Cd2+/Zn2+-exporting ATPase/Cu+-exporting ATPase